MKEKNTERQIVSRLHRLEGQVRSLERILGQDEPEQAIMQFEAIIAAAKALLALYAAQTLQRPDLEGRQKEQILSRLIKKFG